MKKLLVVSLIIAVVAACDRPAPQTQTQTQTQAPVGAPAASEPAPVSLPRTPAPPDAAVTILSPADGAVVTSPFTVSFGAEGIAVVPAGDFSPASGHHHLLIDADLPENPGLPLPTDDQHRHYGLGQTETELELAPGEYTLRLVMGDGNHVPHDPPIVSAPVIITVQ